MTVTAGIIDLSGSALGGSGDTSGCDKTPEQACQWTLNDEKGHGGRITNITPINYFFTIL